MKKLSVSEFAEFCIAKKPSSYIYATSNQQDAQENYIRMNLIFHTVIINLKPDRICFANEHDRMSVEMVKYVQVYEEKPCVGTVFRIYSNGNGGDKVSVWIME